YNKIERKIVRFTLQLKTFIKTPLKPCYTEIDKNAFICYNVDMKEFIFVVDRQFNNIKPLTFLSEMGVSDEIIKKVKFGSVFINGEVLKNANDSLSVGDKVKFILPPDKPNPYVLPIKAPLDVIYEDQYLIAVNKPKGILTHSSRHNQTASLEQVVCGYFLPLPFTFRPVNRLDKDTSGIVLIAKDAYTASLLSEQIAKGEMQKTYSALVVGELPSEHFIIEKPIKRLSPSSIKRTCADDGTYAKSECTLIKKLNDGKSLIDVRLHTGRTHQIRVHLSSVGLPLFADSLYGEKVEGQTYTLHAKELKFIHPITKKEMVIKAK
ncbi:MAG: RluA family pseudouridine synthase, partial [Clostridia bacterium]|nr:RluA family pseudouridine synthase [Clostridia bacterium]